MTDGADTNVPIGVYRTATPDITSIQTYESFLNMPAGKTVDYVLAFMGDNPTWAQFEQAMLQTRTNGPSGTVPATAWAPLLGTRQLVLGIPACAQGSTWATEAAGTNDAHWTALAVTLVSGGLGNCILRIAREFQGGWNWKVTSANIPDFKAGWVHIVSVMRAAGFTGKFMWNPYIGTLSGGEAVNAYPGGSVVDIVGVDFYDGGYAPPGEEIRSAASQQVIWNSFRDQWDGLTGYRTWTVSIGKPLAYPEWGLGLWNTGALYSGGGDNPVLIQEMADWVKDTRPLFHGPWEDRGMGVSDPDSDPNRFIAVPQSRAVFLNEFGYSTS